MAKKDTKNTAREHSEDIFVDILGIYPGMYASKFVVKKDTWDIFFMNHMNSEMPGNCFMPCRDAEGDQIFVDMNKLLAFYVLEPTKPEKNKSDRPKK